jgi:hypothetical protein
MDVRGHLLDLGRALHPRRHSPRWMRGGMSGLSRLFHFYAMTSSTMIGHIRPFFCLLGMLFITLECSYFLQSTCTTNSLFFSRRCSLGRIVVFSFWNSYHLFSYHLSYSDYHSHLSRPPGIKCDFWPRSAIAPCSVINIQSDLRHKPTGIPCQHCSSPHQ